MKLKRRWFTLVELIVVVTILAILGTIGFISYNWYLVWVRDSNRLAQIDQLSSGLELFRAKNTLPLPWDDIRVEIGTTTSLLIWYQWYLTQDIMDLMDYTKWGKDPKDGTFFTFYVSWDRKYFQLLGFLEDQTNQATSFFLPNQAHAADYTVRYFATWGKKLWILVDSSNTPIQESPNVTGTGEFNMSTQSNTFTMIFNDKNTVTASAPNLASYNYQASCKRLKEIGWNRGDGIYTINPKWNFQFQAYCNMTFEWGGWTLIGRSTAWGSPSTSFGFNQILWNVADDTVPYSMGVIGSWVTFNEVMLGNYVSGKDLWNKVYKFNLFPANASLSWAMAGAVSVDISTLKWLWSRCTWPGWNNGLLPTEITYIGNTNRNNGFFVWTWAIATYGLASTGFAISASAWGCANGELNASWAVVTQWEIFVR